jgi:hypothetical protein
MMLGLVPNQDQDNANMEALVLMKYNESIQYQYLISIWKGHASTTLLNTHH